MTVFEKKWNGITRCEYYNEGAVKDLTFEEINRVETAVGTLIPKFTDGEARRKYTSSVSFYEDGSVKRVALERQTLIDTPIGGYPAECVTFYPNGQLKRFFPLNGKISGYWTIEDETALAQEFQFHLSVGAFKAKIVGASFYESGALKSFILWPGEEIIINTNAGLFPIRIGFSLYESGAVKSLEPAYPIELITPIGDVTVYDENAVGIESDDNSLKFDEHGNIIGFTAAYCSIAAFCSDGRKIAIEPHYEPSMTDDEVMVRLPLAVSIESDEVIIDNGEKTEIFSYSKDSFVIRKEYNINPKMHAGCSGENCSSCSLCGN